VALPVCLDIDILEKVPVFINRIHDFMFKWPCIVTSFE
jgi:hypothetical protein